MFIPLHPLALRLALVAMATSPLLTRELRTALTVSDYRDAGIADYRGLITP